MIDGGLPYDPVYDELGRQSPSRPYYWVWRLDQDAFCEWPIIMVSVSERRWRRRVCWRGLLAWEHLSVRATSNTLPPIIYNDDNDVTNLFQASSPTNSQKTGHCLWWLQRARIDHVALCLLITASPYFGKKGFLWSSLEEHSRGRGGTWLAGCMTPRLIIKYWYRHNISNQLSYQPESSTCHRCSITKAAKQ